MGVNWVLESLQFALLKIYYMAERAYDLHCKYTTALATAMQLPRKEDVSVIVTEINKFTDFAWYGRSKVKDIKRKSLNSKSLLNKLKFLEDMAHDKHNSLSK